MKDRLRVVKYKESRRKIKEATKVQVKKTTDINSKKVDEDFSVCKRHKKITSMITQEKTKI